MSIRSLTNCQTGKPKNQLMYILLFATLERVVSAFMIEAAWNLIRHCLQKTPNLGTKSQRWLKQSALDWRAGHFSRVEQGDRNSSSTGSMNFASCLAAEQRFWKVNTRVVCCWRWTCCSQDVSWYLAKYCELCGGAMFDLFVTTVMRWCKLSMLGAQQFKLHSQSFFTCVGSMYTQPSPLGLPCNRTISLFQSDYDHQRQHGYVAIQEAQTF